MLHRLMVLWAPPRSLSTAFVRIIAARGDFSILHEPLCDVAACGRYVHRTGPGEPVTLDGAQQVLEHVQALRAAGPVFVKDTCEYAYDAMIDGSAYLRDATHVFMLRDPALVINSHYHINAALTSDEVGYAHLARLYRMVRAQAAQAPLFVDADELATSPDATMAAFCAAAGLPHIPQAMHWHAGHLPLWERTQRWHEDAANSTGIRPSRQQYAVSVDNNATLRGFYDDNLPHYQYLQHERRQAAPGGVPA